MTMIRPAAAGLMSRVFDSVGMKAVLTAVLTSTAWHYTDAGEIKDLRRQNKEQQSQLNYQRTQLEKRVDRETYDHDQHELHEDLREIRLSQGRIEQILMEHGK